MAGDLNLKKSWNPALMKNREKVWKLEQQMFKEHKEQQHRDAKLNDLKSQSELLAIHQDGNEEKEMDLVTKVVDKTRWMYKGPKDEKEAEEMVNEDYLLGKKKLTGLVTEANSQSETKQGSGRSSGQGFDRVMSLGGKSEQSEDSLQKEKDNLDKSDPLYVIKLQELKRKELRIRQDKLKRYKGQSSSHKSKDSHRDARKSSRHDSHDHHRSSRRRDNRRESPNHLSSNRDYRYNDKDSDHRKRNGHRSHDYDSQRSNHNQYRDGRY